MNKEQYKSKQNQIAKLQEEVNTYEIRQEKIKEFKKQMSELVKSTVEHKFFYVDDTVIFVGYGYSNTGLLQGLLHGVAKTSKEDIYEKDLGQIIAVFRAFGVPVGKVIKLVERKATGGYILPNNLNLNYRVLNNNDFNKIVANMSQ